MLTLIDSTRPAILKLMDDRLKRGGGGEWVLEKAKIMIEIVSEKNLHEVLPLIRQYQEFYKAADISDSRNAEFFSQFGEKNPSGCQFLFRQGGSVVGFATVYFTYSSTLAAKVAIMNDLYTVPEMRGRGIGRKLIEHCHNYAAENGAVRLQWLTAPDNQQAQSLYESMKTGKSKWLLYTYKT